MNRLLPFVVNGRTHKPAVHATQSRNTAISYSVLRQVQRTRLFETHILWWFVISVPWVYTYVCILYWWYMVCSKNQLFFATYLLYIDDTSVCLYLYWSKVMRWRKQWHKRVLEKWTYCGFLIFTRSAGSKKL